jgi:cellulose synthase (UDP-forming)
MSEHRKIRTMRILAFLGIVTLLTYFEWWFEGWKIANPLLAITFVGAVICALPQLLGTWFLYLKVRPLPVPTMPISRLSVDVFVTAYKEPLPLVRRALKAAYAIRGRHKTWLLDDGGDPKLARLARELGAGYLTRADHTHAKAGNINAALAHTSGDIIAIFDVDHAPVPAFLERTLGFFSDPHIGFVQVMLTFRNSAQSWIARAANETSLDYYNPTLRGAEGLKGATLTGSNALIRRSALEAIGGYQPGLAEDLATSIVLHSAGWQSMYVNEPLAPGLAPHDLTAWFTQQLKWARGVFEVLLSAYPRLFRKLTWGQRASYAVRMTYYWIGPVIGAHILFTIGILFWGSQSAMQDYSAYLLRLILVASAAVLIRLVALGNWRHPSVKRSLLWRPVVLIFATWPIYTLAWIMALLRLPLAFRPTPKSSNRSFNPRWLLAQAASILGLGIGIPSATYRLEPWFPLVWLFAALLLFLQVPILFLWPNLDKNQGGIVRDPTEAVN